LLKGSLAMRAFESLRVEIGLDPLETSRAIH
jgi:hypothetical protein